MLRVGVLASGRGSNLQAILRWQRAGLLRAQVVLVICNHADAPALDLAGQQGVETHICLLQKRVHREAVQMQMSRLLAERGVGLVVLAGYDRILAPGFVQQWAGKMMNVHPSLLPSFAGSLHPQADALRHGVKVTGCTVHFVDENVDGGPIISQAAVAVLHGDDSESLSARILEQEHRLLPAAIRAYADGRLRIDGRTVVTRGE